MKLFIFLILFSIQANFASDCLVLDLDHKVESVFGEKAEGSEDDGSILELILDIFDVLQCVDNAETIDDLNISESSLMTLKTSMEKALLISINEEKQEIKNLQDQLSLETNLQVIQGLQDRINYMRIELDILIADTRLFIRKIENLLAS